jgi:hypothetical protein
VEFMERVAPVVDETISALASVRFVEDPIAGVKYSRATSITSSAYKRHGRILEIALRESLRESNRHKVWRDDAFRVSREADALASTQDLLACVQSTLPYGNSIRTLQVDLFAFDHAREWPVRHRENTLDYAGPQMRSGSSEELWRVSEAQLIFCRIQDHLLLWCSLHPKSLVASET